MYSQKFLCSTPFPRPNLKIPPNVSSKHCFCTNRSAPLSKFGTAMNNFIAKVKILCRTKIFTQKCHDKIIIRAWTRQCEYIAAQRFRRTQQMFSLYSRLWEERALRDLLSRMRQQLTRHGRNFMLSAVGIAAFSWEKQKITDDEIYQHMSEFDYVNRLKEQTILCKYCQQRRLVDIMLPDMTYCKCKCSGSNDDYSLDEWVPFLERKDLLVWRRQRPNSSNYEYKLYGTYDDVTAEDFLQVQVDTSYRQQWDTTAINLYVVDTDPTSNSDVIYWEMLWPRMFSNRDYVYNRRYLVDEHQRVITIVSKSIEHPACPLKPEKHRVRDYESCMVIKASARELHQVGIEFSLTYFDDPGVNIPAAVTSWVAIAGMPDFLTKLRLAAKEYRQNKTNKPEEVETEIVEVKPDVSSCSGSSSYWRYIHPYYYLG